MADELKAFALGLIVGGLLLWAAVAPSKEQVMAGPDCVGPFAEGLALFFGQRIPKEKQCR